MTVIDRTWTRFSVLALVLLSTLGLLKTRDREEVLPPRNNIEKFPSCAWQLAGQRYHNHP